MFSRAPALHKLAGQLYISMLDGQIVQSWSPAEHLPGYFGSYAPLGKYLQKHRVFKTPINNMGLFDSG